jgi:hypothetical protein
VEGGGGILQESPKTDDENTGVSVNSMQKIQNGFCSNLEGFLLAGGSSKP